MANPSQPGFPYTVVNDPVKPKPEEMKLDSPAERPPRCPRPGCGSYLTPVDQNAAADILFECMAGGWSVHDYHAVYRSGTGRYTHRYDPSQPTAPPPGWLPPVLTRPDEVPDPETSRHREEPVERPPLLPILTGEEQPEPIDVRPALAGLVPSSTVVITPSRLAEEFKAGGSMTEIAARYGISVQEVEASIRVVAMTMGESHPAEHASGSGGGERGDAAAPRRRRRRKPRLNAQRRQSPEAGSA